MGLHKGAEMKKMLVSALLLTGSVSASPIAFSGSTSIDAELDSIQGASQGRPSTTLSLSLNPTLSIYGMPISFNFYLSSQESNLRQELNKYRIFLEPKKLLRDMVNLPGFAFSISAIELGTTSPSYSSLTLSGVSVTGGAIELNPWLFYLAATGGQSQRSVVGTESTDAAYSRMLVAGRFGFGKKEKSHLIFTVLHAQDDPNSIPAYTIPFDPDTTDTLAADSVEVVTPEENYCAGAEAKLTFFNDHVTLEAEISGSEFTRDVRTEEMNLIGIPSGLVNLIHPRLSSSFDYAWTVKPTFDILGTKLYGTIKMIGPGFVSLGVPSMRNDNFAYEAGIEKGFFNNALSLAGSYTSERDNLINWKNYTTTYTAYNLNLGLNFTPFPSLQVGYSPYVQQSGDVNTRGDLINANSGYSFITWGLTHTLNFSVSYQLSREQSSAETSSSISYLPAYNLSFSFPFSCGVSFELDQSRSATDTDENLSFDVNGSYTFFNKWINTLGLKRSTATNQNQSTGIYCNSSVPLWIIGNLNLSLERNSYHDPDPTQNYNELRLRASLAKSW